MTWLRPYVYDERFGQMGADNATLLVMKHLFYKANRLGETCDCMRQLLRPEQKQTCAPILSKINASRRPCLSSSSKGTTKTRPIFL
jgi:hypothetical protein